MVFLAEQTIPIPEKDINSWIFDEVSYEENQAVSSPTPSVNEREISMWLMPAAESFIVHF